MAGEGKQEFFWSVENGQTFFLFLLLVLFSVMKYKSFLKIDVIDKLSHHPELTAYFSIKDLPNLFRLEIQVNYSSILLVSCRIMSLECLKTQNHDLIA